jgi:hypothetical protein
MWMRKVADKDAADLPEYNVMFCRPQKENERMGINHLPILLDKDMISDHMSPQYEQALYSVLRQMISHSGGDGYVLPSN